MKNTAILPGLCLGLALLPAAFAGAKDGTLDVYWIDSEGGGSTLIVTPAGESVLIDTGNPGGRDPGRIVAAAKAAGLERLDYVLLTHYHVDHFGGGAEVAAQLPVGAIYERGIPPGDPDGRTPSTFPLQIKPWRDLPVRREKLAPGVVLPLRAAPGGAAFELRCLAADQRQVAPTAAQLRVTNSRPLPPPPHAVDPTDNDNSAVFLLSFGGFRFFDGGDLTWDREARLVSPHNVVGPVDVYQTDHHGLEVSNNPVLLQSLAPTVCVMNNGPTKGGKPETFAGLKTVASLQALYQVHKSMNVSAAANAPDEFIANLEEFKPADGCPGNLIKLSVAPDGRSYTVTVPARGHARTYATTTK
ncbi:MBL fold metallo-hydrolase [Opitutus sp. GAS368]|uniref:ComEC/Rec2 family competence protein n=1 Tax=Opitutus sp. GAS368 TaxID=1882749 RepID=UPI00087B043D|nr:MBL fold metallo-hydrolase [Opitutus sp. GAS368]SDS00025.1 Metal-dependent hydrolase, beta-lactamase superfamily II [Opitutus sp. GAS368]